jgi:hypothetical protein
MGTTLRNLVDAHRGTNSIAYSDSRLPEYAIFYITYQVEDAPIFKVGSLFRYRG